MLLAAALTLAACTVTDGDTIRCGTERIRLAAIDTAELQARCPAERDLALRAKARLGELLAGGFEIHREGVDRYRRTLATVTVNGVSVGETLVREGLARRWDGARRSWCGG